jgi:hypothetical protein
MRPLANPIAKKVAFPANGSYGKPIGNFKQPEVTPQLALKKQKEKKDIYIGTPQDQVGIIHNPYNMSRGCRSINDLRKVHKGNGKLYDRQLLNAQPPTAFHTPGMIREREGMFGANFKQTNQFAHIGTW